MDYDDVDKISRGSDQTFIHHHVDPPCGVLDPKEAVLLAVSCDAFAFGQEDTNNDRITVEWTNNPDGAAKQFRDGIVRRKNLPIEYNP
ncbi:Protein CBG08633 [Caenorhabditis briggsae]|uniref:Protein CBG08633 n=1 Tax=Caenorhabditis briggsae TaxID=6238 RepID=A8X6Y0_CAEBR|nr:Protein CBG08633 [Caenorhabditis briggsae]CAP28391.1 Protein CBG08633 [Caenorhabditis briggsae]